MNDYKDLTNASQLPPGYESYLYTDYNVVFGTPASQLISGRIIKGIKARVALLAASPAFNTANDVALWTKAANYAGTVINDIGGIAGLDPNGHRYYDSNKSGCYKPCIRYRPERDVVEKGNFS